MASRRLLALSLFVLVNALATTQLAHAAKPHSISYYNRTSFPSDFLFGTASAAYQYEGAAFEYGKGPSIWDNFTHQYPEKTNGENGDVATDFYHRYKGDTQIMKFMGMNAFRFSISWSRIIPTGKLKDGVNPKGILFYKSLINDIIAKGMVPMATLFHWDLPQGLEDAYGGFLSSKVVADFADFADLCYKHFGDRVKYWITLNEPWTFCWQGYDIGTLAPGRCSAWMNRNCTGGNSGTEPYIVGHNMLLSHAAAVKVYRDRYQKYQKGKIGITLVSHWFIPYHNTTADSDAARRAIDFMLGWFMTPIHYGHYPKIMQKNVGSRLPSFTAAETVMVNGSYDFLGLNYYTSNYAADVSYVNPVNLSFSTDNHANLTTHRDGVSIGIPEGVNDFYVYPQGLTDLLLYIMTKYQNPTVYITENGMGQVDIHEVEKGVNDPQRAVFYADHLKAVETAMKGGANVKGYIAWSFSDNFEWSSGYNPRFGIVYIDYKKNLTRHLKRSAYWFKKFLLA
ncbi:Beta-primeverosidase [Bertholletia excelsa]